MECIGVLLLFSNIHKSMSSGDTVSINRSIK